MGPRLAWSNILSEMTSQDEVATTHIKRINSQLGILNQTLSYSFCMSEFFDAWEYISGSEDTEEEIDDGESEEDRSDGVAGRQEITNRILSKFNFI